MIIKAKEVDGKILLINTDNIIYVKKSYSKKDCIVLWMNGYGELVIDMTIEELSNLLDAKNCL
jgi:hypothetical protein